MVDPENAIEIHNISKTYKIKVEDRGGKKGLFSRRPMKIIENKVINDFSLNIKKGDVLGVLGRNGSGKSTLLSLLAKIMEPDTGTIERSGKIASILELGMGFHLDMSGRENIYLKGELYGFSKKEIDKKIDHIIEYSGIGKYIDNPVRTYSSGMTGRLAFSIMVNVDSDIMLVDEVLSVGDRVFQSKAREFFKQVSDSGKTVVFVSHQIETLESMCNRAIWIEGGKIMKEGDVREVCAEYQNMMNESPDIIKDLADAGASDPQYKLALMYRDGINYHVNEELYKDLIKKAAIQGHIKAQVEYGDILVKEGKIKEAISSYRYAADRGSNEARMKISSINTEEKDDLLELFNVYEKMAIDGDAINEFRYGELLQKTTWTNEDREKSFNYYLKSARDGYPNAMYQIGIMYRDGNGVARDLNKMEHYLISSADSGYMPAITLLASIYYQGLLLPKNYEKSFELTLKASMLGNELSMYKLAMMYRDGIGTEKNEIESEKWFHNFSQSELLWYRIWATDYIGYLYDNDDFIVEDFLNRLSNSSNPGAISHNIAYKIINGMDVTDDFSRMELLSENGNIEAIKRLGNYYYEGIGVEKDYTKAKKWYEKGAMLGDASCKMRLGELYRDGNGVGVDFNKAIHYFMDSAKCGNIVAIANIVSISIENNDAGSMKKAIRLMYYFAKCGNIEAIKRLGNYYYEGIGVEKDYTKAKKWYEKGAMLGDKWCKNHIAVLNDKK